MKNRRASVLCRCTWYMAQPGSLRECSVSFSKSAATSVSCPTFAIQVTANTTIVLLLRRGKCAGEAILGLLRGRLQLSNEFVNQDGVTAIRSGGNHSGLGSRFFLDKCEIRARLLRKLFVVGDAFGRSLPARQLLVNALDLLVSTGVRGSFVGLFAVDFVAHTDGNLRQLVEHVEFGDDQPRSAVDHAGVAQQRQIEPAGAPRTSGDRAIFVATLAQIVAGIGFVFAGEWPLADASAISLGDADNRVDG